MSVGLVIRQLIPQSLKNLLRQRSLPWRLSNLLSQYLPQCVCVDVGASHYPHVKWLAFLNSPKTYWLAVEPNEENLGYLKPWAWRCQVSACTKGLSRKGGMQTLYVTNVDTGSSLLSPVIPTSMQHRVTNLSYFYPVKERNIETLTLIQALAGMPDNAPIFIKLDTQGTELSILQGACALFQAHRIVGIEMESTLLAQPVMQGSSKFWQACEYMEAQGFELLHIKPISAVPKSGNITARYNTYLNECDAIFAIRMDVAAQLSVEYRVALLAFYLTNLFYEEGMSMLQQDKELVSFLNKQDCPVKALISTIQASL